jgi:thioredoxin reductase (NADPH)
MEKLIIIGSGPAGLTAAIYAGRANLAPLVISGYQPGGQLMLTTDVENFPGFPDAVQGPDLMTQMRAQAERFGTRFVDRDVALVDFMAHPFKISVEDESYEAQTIIIATGASARWLGIESEARLRGKGVSACATCDGFFFKDKHVVVVGGGDSAMEESLFLSRIASRVTLIHRRGEFRASKVLQERVLSNEKIFVEWNTVVEEILGKDSVSGVALRNVKTNEEKRIACDGIFIAIGHMPNTELFRNQIKLDERGYIVIKNNTETSISGIFAAGDVCDYRYKQAITAAGSGCMAAIDAEKFLESLE